MEILALLRRPRWPGWRHLPRDARDTLFLLGVIGWTVLPHVARLPWWCTALTALVLAWRAQIALANAPLPRRWVVVLVLLAVAVLTGFTYRTLLGKEAGITLVISMMALKTLELRARRDAFVVFFLGFFIVLTQFLDSQSLPVAAAMLIAVWGLLTALVLAHMPVGQPSLKQAALLAARTALLGAPLMALLFVLFPRLGPLWGVPQDAAATTGLSNSMTLGSVALVAQDDGVALRLRFPDGRSPPRANLYFRGPVLTSFDGREWRRLEPSRFARHGDDALAVFGAPVPYEMTLEPLRLTVLPLLEATPDSERTAPRIDGLAASSRGNLEWRTERPITERLRFTAEAWLRFDYGPRQPEPGLRDDLQLPAGYNPRTIAWAETLRREPAHAKTDARTLAAAVLRHIAQGGYTYTLEPGSYGDASGHDAIDEFWLDRKLGFCEHFAAAFVVVMRAMGVPARVVTGYQGTDPAPADGYWIVRNSYAHAWAEYWQQGLGWVRADPTAAVAPDRIGLSRNLLPRPGLVAGAIESVSPDLLAALRRTWEATNNRWNQWVLSYSRSQQLDLLKDLGVASPSWEDLAYLLIGALCALSLAGAAWAWWDRQRQDPWMRLAARVRRELRGLGVESAPHQPPRALARALREHLGASAEMLAAQLESLDRLRYARGATRLPPARWRRDFTAEARALARWRATRPR
jgi:transglutaminase-like putative cysteine protease